MRFRRPKRLPAGQHTRFQYDDLGGYLKVKPVVSLDNVFRGLAKSLPERMASLIPANEAAIQKGMEIIRVPEMVA